MIKKSIHDENQKRLSPKVKQKKEKKAAHLEMRFEPDKQMEVPRTVWESTIVWTEGATQILRRKEELE